MGERARALPAPDAAGGAPVIDLDADDERALDLATLADEEHDLDGDRARERATCSSEPDPEGLATLPLFAWRYR